MKSTPFLTGLKIVHDKNAFPKQWIKGSLVNLICAAKSLSKQDLPIMVTCSSKIVQSPETILSKLATFPCIHWVAVGCVPTAHWCGGCGPPSHGVWSCVWEGGCGHTHIAWSHTPWDRGPHPLPPWSHPLVTHTPPGHTPSHTPLPMVTLHLVIHPWSHPPSVTLPSQTPHYTPSHTHPLVTPFLPNPPWTDRCLWKHNLPRFATQCGR